MPDTPQTSDTPGPASDGAATVAAEQPATAGRSAEARELERQLDEVRAQLKAAEARAQENLDRWQRAQADLANFRRRAQFEREELEKFATGALVTALLPVLDSFDRAWQTLPGQFRRLTWLSGVAMIHQQLLGTLERIGLTEIPAQGQPFDPSLHEAVDREEGEGPPYVVAVLQTGYKLHERVIRPALVKVGPKPAEPVETEQATPPAQATPASPPSMEAAPASAEPAGQAASASEAPAASASSEQ